MAVQKILIIDPATSLDAELTPNTTSAGAADAGKIPALNASGVIDITMLPPGVGAATQTFPATEALAAGALVNIWSSGGTPSVRNANATDATKPCNGIVLSAYASAATATVYFPTALVTGLSGLTIGGRVYLGTTAGVATSTPPSATGNLMQPVGTAVSATELAFELFSGTIRG